MDECGPDEFFTHEADAVAWEACIFISEIRIAQVHHDAGAGRCEVFSDYGLSSALCLLRFVFLHKVSDDAVINDAVLCVDGDVLAGFQYFGRFYAAALGADDAWNAEFAGNDRSVAGHAASIGDDRDGFLHSRYPVRGGHRGDEDFAFLEFIDILRVGDDVAFACCHSRAGRKTFDEYFMIGGQFHFSACFLFFILLGPNGFRTSLEDPDAVLVVDSPFHIHVAAIVLFNGFRIGSELDDLFISESLRLGKVFRYFSFFYIAARFTNEFDGLFIDMAGSDGEVFLVDDEVIRGDGALYDVFAKTPGAFDHDGLVIAVGNVYGEHDACDFGVSHHLYGSGESDVFMVEVLLRSVVYSAVGEGGCVAFLDLTDDHVTAGDIQVGVLLACEGSIRQVFCGSRGTNGYIWIFFVDFLGEFFVSIADRSCEVFRHFSGNDAFADLSAYFMEFDRVLYIGKTLQQFVDLFVLSGDIHEITVSMSCCRVAVWYRHAGRGRQFTQRRRFPSDQIDIFSVQFIKPQYISILSCVHHVLLNNEDKNR